MRPKICSERQETVSGSSLVYNCIYSNTTSLVFMSIPGAGSRDMNHLTDGEVRLLGRFEVGVANRVLYGSESRKVRVLLAYLALGMTSWSPAGRGWWPNRAVRHGGFGADAACSGPRRPTAAGAPARAGYGAGALRKKRNAGPEGPASPTNVSLCQRAQEH